MARSNPTATQDDPPPIGHNRPPTPVDLLKTHLQETYSEEIAKAEPLAVRANAAVEVIASDADLAVWAEIGRDAAKLSKALDEARLTEKRPIVEAVDSFFKTSLDRVNRISAAAVARATAWNKKKAQIERERQEAAAQRLRDEAEARRIAAEFETDETAATAAATDAKLIEMQAEAAAAPKTTADLTRVTTDSGVMTTTAKTWDFEIVDPAKIDLNAIRLFIDPKAIETAIRKIVRSQKGATKIEGVRVFEKETAQFRG
ncbi:hypothetical protein [Bradyrhizobium sp. USDA 4350]